MNLQRMGKIKANFISLFIAISLTTGKEIKETDNIAVEQRGVPAIISLAPAPGLRFRQRPYIPPNNNIDNFVGHLLPMEPKMVMSQIIGLDVGCYPERMVVSILFDQPFNGIIYSKGFYGVPECSYLRPNTGAREVQFEILGNGCGLQFIDPPGQPPFMENVIIIQNEPGIQEIWDTARGLRCMYDPRTDWDKQTVSAALNVAMLEQQVVTFSTDIQASASMDIQIGRGPFAPSASGLVKIGELMTMVVSVEGPPEIDLHVRQCIAHDGTNDNTIDLTDQYGCVLKKKIIGSWQKQRATSPPVLAFAHFQAFKFPDKMDVFIECEVDLCSGECPVCQEDQSNLHLRKRRALPRHSVSDTKIPSFEEAVDELENLEKLNANTRNDVRDISNRTENAALRLARRLRVLSPDDISVNGDEFSTFTIVARSPNAQGEDDVCMSLVSFVIGIVVMLLVLVASSVLTAVLCVRVRTIPSSESSFPPDSSFHAFSTVSGKNT